MNPRAYRLQLGIILFGILAWIPVASAQNPAIADADKISGSVTREAHEKFVQTSVAALAGKDLDARTKAREELVDAATVKGRSGQDPSPSYLDQYADVLNESLKTLAANPNWAVRMNAAIVAARVAEHADNTRLLEVTQILLGDKTEGVQLWALRAARFVLPAELRSPGAAKNDKLIPAILSVTQQRKSGAIAAEAYTALTLDYYNLNRYKSIPTNVTTEMFTSVVPQLLAIMRNRIADYQNGTVNDPSAERIAANFLISTTVWPLLDPKTQSAVLQVLLDLLAASGTAAEKAGGPGKNDDFLQTMRDTARALSAWALKVPGSEAIKRPLQEIYSPQNMRPWQQIPQVVQELTKLDKNVKPPAAPTTAPAGK